MRSLIIVCSCSPRAAHAEPVVLAVDGKDIYVDLGAKDGVGAGSELELLHEIVAKDPRTGATLRDHFALGTIDRRQERRRASRRARRRRRSRSACSPAISVRLVVGEAHVRRSVGRAGRREQGPVARAAEHRAPAPARRRSRRARAPGLAGDARPAARAAHRALADAARRRSADAVSQGRSRREIASLQGADPRARRGARASASSTAPERARRCASSSSSRSSSRRAATRR